MRRPGPLVRVLLGILRWVLPSDWAGDVVRDLEEDCRRRAAGGRLRAGLWLLAQAVSFALRFGMERIRDGTARLRTAAPRAARRLRAGHVGTVAEDLIHDLRHTVRGLRSSPLFVTSVVLTLSVGVGATTTIFAVVRGVLLEPLPYPSAERLLVMDPNAWTPAGILQRLRVPGASLERLEAYYARRYALTGAGGPAEVEGADVTPDLLPLLGARVALGRHFDEGDARPGAADVAVVSHGLWQRLFGAPPEIGGRTLRINGREHRVVGVLEPGFRQLTPRTDGPEVWTPAALDRLGADALPEGSIPWAIPVARLGPDAPVQEAGRELEAAVAAWRAEGAGGDEGPSWDFRWTSLPAEVTGPVRRPLLLLQGAVLLVLLLACVNVANLLLVRFGARRGEAAVRAALGATRGRLLRQLGGETLLLFVLGGLGGLTCTAAALDLVVRLAPGNVPRLDRVSLDPSLVAVGLGLALLTGLVFGGLPALLLARSAPGSGLREHRRGDTGSRRLRRVRQAIVVAEVALTLVLLAGAALLGRSFLSLAGQSPGFRIQDVMAVELNVPDHRYETVPALEDFYHRMVERLADVPRVTAAGVSNNLPLARGSARRLFVVEGEDEPREAQYGVVSPGYFRALDIPLRRGRYLEERDVRGAPRVAVVDRAMADRVWPGRDPVGMRFRMVDEEAWVEVVGVVADIRGSGLAAQPEPGFYISYRQRPATPVELGVGRNAVLLVHAPERTRDLPAAIRGAIQEVDPEQAVEAMAALETLLAEEVGPERFRAVLVGAFAMIALVLATIGIQGVVGSLLAERRRELGIRRAVGASDMELVRQVLGWGARLAVLGVLAGLAVLFAAGPVLEGLLHGIAPMDPATVGLTVAGVVALTVLAALPPAIRAVRGDTVAALRSE